MEKVCDQCFKFYYHLISLLSPRFVLFISYHLIGIAFDIDITTFQRECTCNFKRIPG